MASKSITVEVQATQTLRKQGRIPIDVADFPEGWSIDYIKRFLYAYPHQLENLDAHEDDIEIDEVRIVEEPDLLEQAQAAFERHVGGVSDEGRAMWVSGWIAGQAR